ncbi:Clavaminate synthase-like protein [Saccharata proteae CBS 121410]|uniref:Clavaminate synthase-like protein n=1 Tax=Saccharata proteae CBS 121410 TaxID=1314787 RepID=A0A9P4M114_9PEZI|nr:Clavaminate synthase-like protein [Saccharata proteae CBS 121410]
MAATVGSIADTTTFDEARTAAGDYLESRLCPKDIAGNDSHIPFAIPTIDLNPSFSSSMEDRRAVAAQINAACVNSGFFYITNHSTPASACEGILTQAQAFFHELPKEKKEAIHMKQSALHRGWEPPEYTSIHGQAETKEGFNWGYETGLDLDAPDGKYVELDGTSPSTLPGGTANLWPEEKDIPGFYEGIRNYYGGVLRLARHLMRLFALSLDLDESYFDDMVSHPGGIARLMYYPAAREELGDGSEDALGLGAHSDYECFTLLLPSSTPGLEVLSPNAEWISLPVVPGGIIVNIADFFMRWTNGIYKSTVHRVINHSREPRYSVPFFFSVNYDQVVETLPSCITPSNPSRYPPIRAGHYILERANATTKDGAGSYGNSDFRES